MAAAQKEGNGCISWMLLTEFPHEVGEDIFLCLVVSYLDKAGLYLYFLVGPCGLL